MSRDKAFPTNSLHISMVLATQTLANCPCKFAGVFFLLRDGHSKWPELFCMSSTQCNKTIKTLKCVFLSYCLPNQLVTDNSCLFTSQEFARFCQENGIRHICTSPYHPSSNRGIEHFVQNFKRSMKASEKEGRKINGRSFIQFLLGYRLTPQDTTGINS